MIPSLRPSNDPPSIRSPCPRLTNIANNPRENAKALSVKTGKVFNTLLDACTSGTQPTTLPVTVHPLGFLVLLMALEHLATLPLDERAHVVQGVYLLPESSHTHIRGTGV